jgi:biotin synthase-related radical SAM superfamily protein
MLKYKTFGVELSKEVKIQPFDNNLMETKNNGINICYQVIKHGYLHQILFYIIAKVLHQ